MLIALFGSTPAYSQQINPRFTHFTIDNGLSQNLVYSITQGRQGFMWFGTKDGLNRFDGYEFKIYHHDPFDSASLSNNMISALFTDSEGRLWVGTAGGGLNLYDRSTDRFSHFLISIANPYETNGDYIKAITEDKGGNLWVGTYGNGLFELSFPKNNRDSLPDRITHYIHQPGDSLSLGGNFIINVFADSRGRLWVSNTSTTIQCANLKERDIHFQTPDFNMQRAGKKFTATGIQFDPDHCSNTPGKTILEEGGAALYEDSLQRLWMGGPQGLLLLDTKRNTITFFDIQNPQLRQAAILSICPASSGKMREGKSLWLGTYNGLGIFNTKTFRFQMITHDPDNPGNLQTGRILKIYQDRSGCMWLGSNGYGLSKFDFRSSLFPVPGYHTADYTTRTKDLSVRSFFDSRKYLLIGTTAGLWKADKHSRLMAKVTFSHGLQNSNLIYSIVPADSGAVWIACNIGLIWYDLQTNQYKLFLTGISGNGETDNRIFKLYNDHHGKLWALTPYSLSAFNIRGKTFTHYYYNHDVINSYDEPAYGDIYQDSKGNFWLGTGDGLLYFDTLKKTFHHYTTNPADTSSLSFNAVRSVVADPKYPDKYLWVGTAGGGLNKFSLHTGKFRHFTIKNGLPNNVVYGILAGEGGYLWLSTNKGISKFNPVSEKFHNYDVNAGLQSNEFNSGAFYKNKKGKLFFGGIRGFNAFYPKDIKDNPHIPQVVFTGFRLFNHLVSSEDKGSPLKKPISETRSITLPYQDNIISFRVAALDYSNPGKNQYAYRLDNLNTHWVMLGTNRLITFTNLAPGHYVLHVKAANSDGVWNKTDTSLQLIIMPPWWKTWWAYLVYFLILLTGLYFFRRYNIKRVRLRDHLRIEHLEAQKLKEMDHLKSRFFANISHEFRTPLTLIMGPVEDLLRGGDMDHFKNILPEIHRSSKRLLQLINQLLDLSRLDAGNLQVNMDREDIIPFVKQIVYSFFSLAQRKNIKLQTEIDPRLSRELAHKTLFFYFDEDIIEKILANLLSNAFKFTPEGGTILVSVTLAPAEKDGLKYLALEVKDNGIGIPADEVTHVFDRFYQVEGSGNQRHGGSGIGLSLVKELIQLHGGKISVVSELGKWTIFSCYLPLNKQIITEKHKISEKAPENHFIPEFIPEITPREDKEDKEDKRVTGNEPIILVVEDQQDVRKYICERLQDTYTVIEAANGKEGLASAIEEIPDLVISDVMMPEMDGFELCKKIKTDDRTSHIPVILLTARAEDNDRMAGLETGADAYLVKPFNSRELLLRVNNLIRGRNMMRMKFSDKLVVKPGEITVTSRDRLFMQNLLSIVEEHLGDAQFSVEKLSGQINMSVSQVNRKLKAIINQTIQQFIRSVRMQRALDLLKNDSATISEVAWQTGFEDPGYFTKVFKQQFGFLPSEREKFPENQSK